MSSRVGRGAVGGHVLGGGGGGGSGGFDPASRYDPTSMGRIADDEIDPDAELFDHAENAANSQGMLGLGGLSLDRVRRNVPTVSIDRRTIRAAVVGLAVVGCIVGASVGIAYAAKNAKPGGGGGDTGGSGGAEVQGSAGGGGAPNAQGIAQFVPPPDDLAMKCAPLTVSMRSGWDACKALCASAECCFLGEGHWFSCRAENEEDCSAYEYGCATLDHVEGLRDGASEPAATDDSNAPPGVGAGAAMGPRSVTLQEAPGDIASVCSAANLASRDGHNECEALCDAAACCAVPDDECSVTNSDACVAYEEPCTDYREAHDSVLEGAKAKCNTDTLSTPEGVQGCRDYCSDAVNACFRGDAHYSDTWCEQYGPCHALTTLKNAQGFTDAAEATKAIEDACKVDFATCRNMCHPAECCFNGDGVTSTCDSSPGLSTLDCGHYDACKILFAGGADGDSDYGSERVRSSGEGDESDAIVIEVEEACSDDSLGTIEGFQDCHEKCAPYLCCFSASEAENCYDDHPIDCETYGACESAYEFDDAGSQQVVVVTKEIVDETCSDITLDYEEGVKECRALCAEHMCCVLPAGMKSNCEDTLGEEECRIYQSCSKLTEAEDDVYVVDEEDGDGALAAGADEEDEDVPEVVVDFEPTVDELCRDDAVESEEGKAICYEKCSERACCFEDGAGNCYTTDKAWCDEYQACTVLEVFAEDGDRK